MLYIKLKVRGKKYEIIITMYVKRDYVPHHTPPSNKILVNYNTK